ncbi:N-acetylmuramoyl-L-alanine amidase [Enterococcus faecalis]|nr:N-acetylmuramoyl-L-alanine amidase [Enterococcus faecalis]
MIEMAKIIAIGAGHGIHTPGKRSPADEREWLFNRVVVDSAIAELNKYQDIKIVRLDDPTGATDVPLATRVRKADNADADVYVSCHHNALRGVWGTHTGVETFAAAPLSANPQSRALANAIHPKVVRAMGLADRGVKGLNYYETATPTMPSIIIEGGFMDSTIDIKKLRSAAHLRQQGIAVATGIAEYLGLKLKPVANIPVKLPDKIGVATMKTTVKAYRSASFDSPVVKTYAKGEVRNIYRTSRGWYMLYDGTWIPSNYGKNFDYVPVKKPEAPIAKIFRVVAGSFLDRKNAEDHQKALKAKGIESFLLIEKNMFRVITGSYSNRINADRQAELVKKAGFATFIAIY